MTHYATLDNTCSCRGGPGLEEVLCQEFWMNCNLSLWLCRTDRFITGTRLDTNCTGTTMTDIKLHILICKYKFSGQLADYVAEGLPTAPLIMHLCSVPCVCCFAHSWQDKFVSLPSEDLQSSPQFEVAAEHGCESSRVTTDLIFSLLPQMQL